MVTPRLVLAGINSAIEIRDGPFSLLADSFHVPVGTGITTKNVFFDGGNAALTTNHGTAAFRQIPQTGKLTRNPWFSSRDVSQNPDGRIRL